MMERWVPTATMTLEYMLTTSPLPPLQDSSDDAGESSSSGDDGGEGSSEEGGDDSEGGEDGGDDDGEEEDEDEDEPEDQMPSIYEACQDSKECAPAKHHFEECTNRVNEGKGFKGEDCMEEL